MNFITALLALIVFTAVYGQAPINLTEDQKLRALQYTVACTAQEKNTLADAVALVRGQFAGLNRNVKCFANCFLERAAFLIDGAVQPTAVLAQLGPIAGADKVNTIMTQCNSLKGSDNCETAFVLYECYYKQNVAIF